MPVEEFRDLGPLVGREAELDRAVTLAGRHRLLTLTGPGGVGKTRLARAVAHRLLTGERDRVGWFCALADVADPAAVREVVAARLGIARAGRSLASALAAPASHGGMLIVLDNCEHVVAAAAEVVDDLLGAGPHVTVLATSREALRLDGEKVFEVHPLPVPDGPDDPDAARSAAVRLFDARARLVRDDFVLDPATLPAVARICRALDGLPLAVEIVAARVRSMAVTDLAGRLGARLSMAHTGPGRHRDLRAVVDWSYRLLEPPERDLFDALAVFPAGADLAAVTAAGPDPDRVADALDGLVTRSLVRLDPTARPPRYRMLETLREYGLERLRDSGGLDAARDRHADHYAAACEQLRAEGLRLWSPRLLRLFVEFDNVRAAVHRALAADAGPERAFRLLAPQWYVGIQRHSREIAELCARAEERWPASRHPLRSEVLATAANSLIAVEELERAREVAEAAIGAATSTVGVALAWRALGKVSALSGDSATGLAHLDRGHAAAVEAGFAPLSCDILGLTVPLLVQLGRRDEALARARDDLDLAAAQDNVYERAWSLMLLGALLLETDPDEAGRCLAEALAESRAIEYPLGTLFSTRALGSLAATRGRDGEAAARFVEALDMAVRTGVTLERWSGVAATLPLLARAGRREVATVAAAHLTTVDGEIARLWAPGWEEARDKILAAASADTIARGRALAADKVISLVRAELAGLPASPAPVAPESAAELHRAGDLWRVTFAGATAHLPLLRGLDDLAVLLRQPGREVPALDLAGGVTAGDLGERVDATARAAYARRIRELQAELDAADAAGDGERAARAGAELDTLTAHLTAAYGLHGARRTGDPAERARAAVTSRIRAAVKKIGAVHEPLGRHLERSIRTGRFCSYKPDEPVAWTVRLTA